MQGRTEQLKELPPELLKGQYLAMGQRGVALFMCSVEKTTAMWSLSWKAPESTSAELNAIFQDPSAAQVSAFPAWQMLQGILSIQLMKLSCWQGWRLRTPGIHVCMILVPLALLLATVEHLILALELASFSVSHSFPGMHGNGWQMETLYRYDGTCSHSEIL